MTLVNYANPALGAVATASSSLSGHPASLAIDGADQTSWQANFNASYRTLKVDLGAPQYITSLRVFALTDNLVSHFDASYSDDDVTYNALDPTFPNNADTTVALDGVSARYWLLRSHGNYWNGTNAGVYSFEIWGPADAPPPPTSPVPDYINAWLDGLEANYVPTIEEWLAAH